MTRPVVYLAQNRALHKARAQLGLSLDDLRVLASAHNLGIKSLSRLSLQQRHALLDELIRKGADIRNPALTLDDLTAEQRAAGNVKRFPGISREEEKLIRTVAARVRWREPDGFTRLCHKIIKAPFPRNHREVTTIRLALQSLIQQQHAHAEETTT